MSVVAGLETKTEVILVSDSQFTDSNGRCFWNCKKIINLGDRALGIAGNTNYMTAVRRAVWRNIPKSLHPEEVGFMLYDTIKSVSSEDPSEFEALYACRSGLYLIGPDGETLQPHRGYDAIGSGACFALGYLFSAEEAAAPLGADSLVGAVRAAVDHDVYCGGPLDVVRIPWVGRLL